MFGCVFSAEFLHPPDQNLRPRPIGRPGRPGLDAGNGPPDPSHIHGAAERFELAHERRITQGRVLDTRSELKQVREKSVKHAELRVKGSITILGQRGGFGEKLGDALAGGGALKDAKGLPASLLRGGHVHFQGESRTAFGELCRELALGGLAMRSAGEDFFDFRAGERGKMKLQATRDDGREKRVR